MTAACASHTGAPKVWYAERRTAKRHAKETGRRWRTKASVYLCGCGGWHVTTRPERQEKARRVAALERLEARQ